MTDSASASAPAAKRLRCEQDASEAGKLLLGSATLTAFSTLRLPSSERFPAEGGGFAPLLTPNRPLELRWKATPKPLVTKKRGKSAVRTPQDNVQACLAASRIDMWAYDKEVGKFPADAARCLVPMLMQDCITIEASVGARPPAELDIGSSIPIFIRVYAKPAIWASDKISMTFGTVAMTEKAEWRRVVRSSSLPFLLKLIGLKLKQKAAVQDKDDGARSLQEETGPPHAIDELDLDDVEMKAEMSEEVAAQLGSCEALERQSLPMVRMPQELLRTSLRPYQAQAVLWMWMRENPGTELPSNLVEGNSKGCMASSMEGPRSQQLDPMWEEYELNNPTRLPLYFNRVTGVLSQHFPESGLAPCRGGILADDMGLGKTLMCLGLLALDKVPELRELVADKWMNLDTMQGGTLLVLPVSLLHQWASEISHHCKAANKPSLHIYHGAGCKVQDLQNFDIVLTTYGTACNASHAAVISKIHWRRVMLDEGHVVKNRLSKRAMAVFGLRATRRWVVTGTPMQNNIDELYSLVRFLGVYPWSLWTAWQQAISDPFRSGDIAGALNEAHKIVQPLLLRRTKQTIDIRSGQPLVLLPPKFVHILEIDLSPVERTLYDSLYRTMKTKFENLLKSDKVLKHYFVCLQMLMMLRQSTCHPFLAFARERPQDASLHAFAQRKFGDMLSLDKQDGDLSERDAEFSKGLWKDVLDEELVVCAACGASIEDREQPNACGHTLCCSCRGPGAGQPSGESAACQRLFAPVVAEGSLPEALHSSKIIALVKALRADMEAGRRVVVFSQWTSFLELVGMALNGQSSPVAWRQFDGSLTTTQRRSMVEWFQQGSKPVGRVLLISLMAGGMGLNLTSASRLYLLDMWWNPAAEEQAIQRIHRIGQTQEVHVYKFVVKDTIDQGILALQRAKALLCEGLMQGKAAHGNFTKLGVDDFKLLFSHGDSHGDVKGCIGGC